MGIFDGGFFNNVFDKVYNEVPDAEKSGIFPEEGTKELGNEYNQFLSDVMSGPRAKDTDWMNDPAFRRNSGLIRDMITSQTGEARQRLGDDANARGFSDSGYMQDQMLGIDRSGTQAYAQGLVGLLNDLENRELELEQREIDRIFPWLGAAAGEDLDIQNINIGSELQQRQQTMNKTKEVVDSIMGGFPGGSPGGGGGGGGGGGMFGAK